MAAALRRKESGTRGVQRMLRRDLEKAKASLDAGGRVSDADFHEVRKLLKRARARLRLLRELLGTRAYRRENRALRDAGRPLRPIRDAKALLETIDRLSRRGSRNQRRQLADERAFLVARRQRTRRRWDADRGLLRASQRAVAAELDRVRRRRGPKRGWSVLGPGIERVYRAGRRALKTARERASVENLHELRKQTKYLWHSLQMLEPMKPKTMKRLADRAHRLSDALGEDHDLALLVEALRRRRGARIVAHLAAPRKARLRSDALSLARRLFARPPRDLSRDLEKRWKAWHGRG